MSLSQQNWNQYQLLLEKYIELLKDNPFVDELILAFLGPIKCWESLSH